jgi:plastocyanin
VASADRQVAAVEKRASPGGIVTVVVFAGIVVAAVVTILYRQNQGTSAPAKANTVVMAQIAFSPKTLTAVKGSEIVFENKDVAPHNVTADDPPTSSGTIAPGKTFRVVVQQPFEYRCTIHPGMDAKVVLAG